MEKSNSVTGKLLAKNSFLNLFGMVIPLVVGIFAIPIAIKGLGTEVFGIFSIIWVILGYFALLDFGLARSTTKFVAEIAENRDHPSIASIIWTAAIISFSLGIIGAAVVFFVTPLLVNSVLDISQEFVSAAIVSFRLAGMALPVILISTSLRGALAAAQRFDLVNIVFIPNSILNFVLPALSLPFGLNLPQVMVAIIITRTAGAIIYLVFNLKTFPVIRRKFTFDSLVLKKLLSFGGWVTVTGIISPVLVYIDRFFIGSILTVSVVAYYTVPYDAINRLRIFPIGLMKSIFPEFSSRAFKKQNSQVFSLFGRAIKYTLLPTGLIALVIFYFAPFILDIWLGETFVENATVITRIFTIGIIINSVAYVPFNFLQGIGRPDLPAKFHIIEFPLYLLLLWQGTKLFGLEGAAIAWLVRVIFDAILLFIYSFKVYSIPIAYIKEQKIYGELALLLLIGVLFFTINMFITIRIAEVLSIIIILAASGVFSWYRFLNENERDLFTSLIGQLYNRSTR